MIANKYKYKYDCRLELAIVEHENIENANVQLLRNSFVYTVRMKYDKQTETEDSVNKGFFTRNANWNSERDSKCINFMKSFLRQCCGPCRILLLSQFE